MVDWVSVGRGPDVDVDMAAGGRHQTHFRADSPLHSLGRTVDSPFPGQSNHGVDHARRNSSYGMWAGEYCTKVEQCNNLPKVRPVD